MLNIEGLQVFYGAVRALRGVYLTVHAGEIVTLLGANGAGKSSLLRAVSGLVPVAGGSITFEGRNVTNMSSQGLVRQGMVQVPEGRQLFFDLTVEENLHVGSYARRDRRQVRADVEELYRKFPRLGERRRQYAGTLSGGEQQMVAIARALISKPRLLMLDEPSMGLAPKMVTEVFRIVQELNHAGTTILLVEQNANMALTVAHRAYILERGSVTCSGMASDLRGNEAVRRSYLGA